MELTLHDGRTLGYAEYGAQHGKPVFFFHGIPGSRIFRPPFDDLTSAIGIRLITMDRPGYGLSTFQQGRRILDWPDDLCELANHLGIDTFSVAAHSGGTPYGCACAYKIADRVTSTSIISGMSPADAPGVLENMIATNTMGMNVGKHIPWSIWQLLIWAFFHGGREHPETIIKPDEHDPTNPDNAVFKRFPRGLEICRESVREAFRHGTTGHAWEAALLVRDWGFRLKDIRIPVYVWHGEADKDASINMGRYLAKAIPGCQATFFPDEGHLLLFDHWQEILEQLSHRIPQVTIWSSPS